MAKWVRPIVTVVVICTLIACSQYTPRPTMSVPSLAPSPPPPFPSPPPYLTRNLLATYDAQGQLLYVTDAAGNPVTDPYLRDRLPASLARSYKRIPLAQVAEAIAELTVIEGALYDSETDQVILFGRKEDSQVPLNPEDLVVALKSIYIRDDPWVSIDPGPHSGEMFVSYSEGIVNTHFGQVLFEADRTLKNLVLGQDNITHQPVTVGVPGYQNLIQLKLALGQFSEGESKHRFWIEVNRMRVALGESKWAIAFRESALVVRTEYLGADYLPLKNSPSDPAAEAFATHLSQYYDQYANEIPVFREVANLAKLVSLAKWIEYAEIPVDLASLESEVQSVETPQTTPAITVIGDKREGSFTHTVSLYGGVSLRFENEYVPPSEQDKSLWHEVLTARPSQTTLEWSFETSGQRYRAVVVPLNRSLVAGGYQNLVEDLVLPGPVPIRLLRRYDSVNLEPGPLGMGWTIGISRLRFPLPKQKYEIAELYSEIILDDLVSGSHIRYRLVGKYSDGRIVYQAIGVENAPDLVLEADRTYTAVQLGELPLRFNEAGLLINQGDWSAGGAQYEYTAGRLVAIKRADGAQIELRYDQYGRLEEARASTGEARHYWYNSRGDLINITDERGQSLAQFEYDEQHRLWREKTGQGNIKRWNIYDDTGRLAAWGDQYGEYVTTFEHGQSTVFYESNEGPVNASYDDDRAAYEMIRKENQDLALLYVAYQNERGHLLLDGQYIQVSGSTLSDPSALREAISRAGVSVPNKPILVMGKGSRMQIDFQEVFPHNLLLYTESLSPPMITSNWEALKSATRPTPTNTAVHLALPRNRQELMNIGLPGWKWKYWRSIFPELAGHVRETGFPLIPASRADIESSMSAQFTVIIVVAHGDGSTIYMPDKRHWSPGEGEKLTNRPIVILISCRSARVTGGRSIAKQLLDRNVRAVGAAYDQVSGEEAEILLKHLLELSRKAGEGETFLNILKKAIEESGIKFFRLIIGKNNIYLLTFI